MVLKVQNTINIAYREKNKTLVIISIDISNDFTNWIHK